ncbi:MAG: NAD(+) diphosphatase [Solobacterium sp.]|nr:NAD(+) diphosphatase [Solobacterium sp.]
MIQEIYPSKLINTYYDRAWTDADTVLLYRDSGVLMRGDRFPLIGECTGTRFTYLFSIDDVHYYTGEYEEIEGFAVRPLAELRTGVDRVTAFAAMTGSHLFRWYDSHRYCGHCCTELVHSRTERVLECPQCHAHYYPQISPAVIVGVVNGNKMLVSQYAGREYTRYALIAGYVEIGETAEEAVQREVREETGLRVRNIRYYKNQPWGMSGSLLIGYFCELDGDDTITLDHTELSLATWMSRENMPDYEDHSSLTAEMMRVFKYAGQ